MIGDGGTGGKTTEPAQLSRGIVHRGMVCGLEKGTEKAYLFIHDSVSFRSYHSYVLYRSRCVGANTGTWSATNITIGCILLFFSKLFWVLRLNSAARELGCDRGRLGRPWKARDAARSKTCAWRLAPDQLMVITNVTLPYCSESITIRFTTTD